MSFGRFAGGLAKGLQPLIESKYRAEAEARRVEAAKRLRQDMRIEEARDEANEKLNAMAAYIQSSRTGGLLFELGEGSEIPEESYISPEDVSSIAAIRGSIPRAASPTYESKELAQQAARGLQAEGVTGTSRRSSRALIEDIRSAFNSGDKETARRALVSADVIDNVLRAIDAKRKAGESAQAALNQQIAMVENPAIQAAKLKQQRAAGEVSIDLQLKGLRIMAPEQRAQRLKDIISETSPEMDKRRIDSKIRFMNGVFETERSLTEEGRKRMAAIERTFLGPDAMAAAKAMNEAATLVGEAKALQMATIEQQYGAGQRQTERDEDKEVRRDIRGENEDHRNAMMLLGNRGTVARHAGLRGESEDQLRKLVGDVNDAELDAVLSEYKVGLASAKTDEYKEARVEKQMAWYLKGQMSKGKAAPANIPDEYKAYYNKGKLSAEVSDYEFLKSIDRLEPLASAQQAVQKGLRIRGDDRVMAKIPQLWADSFADAIAREQPAGAAAAKTWREANGYEPTAWTGQQRESMRDKVEEGWFDKAKEYNDLRHTVRTLNPRYGGERMAKIDWSMQDLASKIGVLRMEQKAAADQVLTGVVKGNMPAAQVYRTAAALQLNPATRSIGTVLSSYQSGKAWREASMGQAQRDAKMAAFTELRNAQAQTMKASGHPDAQKEALKILGRKWAIQTRIIPLNNGDKIAASIVEFEPGYAPKGQDLHIIAKELDVHDNKLQDKLGVPAGGQGTTVPGRMLLPAVPSPNKHKGAYQITP